MVMGAMFVLFLSALEQTIVATALPAIMTDLGRIDLGSWVVTAYLLSSVCATPVFGKLSDLYGRAIVLRGCLVVFVAASALCAMAPTMHKRESSSAPSTIAASNSTSTRASARRHARTTPALW